MLNRNVTRVIKNSTEVTYYTNTPSSGTTTWNLATTDAVYIGFQGKFSSRYFQLGTVNSVANTLSVYYWDGSQYTAVQDLIDQTLGFTQSGFISWTNAADWKDHNQSGTDSNLSLFWIKIVVGANLSAGTTLQAILNLFCDDSMVSAYYPEIISDTRYLPSGKTNWLEQYLAAKDLVVLRLVQRKVIENESQIIDINSVATAATHAAAFLILSVIATNDLMRERAKDAYDKFHYEISQTNFDVDVNNDGIISSTERSMTSTGFIARR